MSFEVWAVDVGHRMAVIIDRSACWAEVLAGLVERSPGIEARWCTPSTLNGHARGADVVVIGDAGGPDSVSDLAAHARSQNPDVKVILLHGAIEGSTGQPLDAGDFDDVLSRDVTDDDFIRAVACVLDGTNRMAHGRELPPKAGHPSAGLTMAEARVLRLVAAGLSNDQIARSLGISTNTVRTHVQRATTKLGADSRLRVAALARKAGVLDGPTAAGMS